MFHDRGILSYISLVRFLCDGPEAVKPAENPFANLP